MKIFVVISLLFSLYSSGQQRKFTYYTTADGLPSNLIYKCIEDDRGFLWIATDAGMVRFDGKNFVTYDTKKGLPDTEILNVIKDGNGVLWLNIFKKGACYYDEKKDRFISEKDDAKLKVTESVVHYINKLSDGSIAYNGMNSEVLKDSRKIIAADAEGKYFGSVTAIYKGVNKYLTANNWMINSWKNGNWVDSIHLFPKNTIRIPISVNDTLYYVNPDDNGIYMFWGFNFSQRTFNEQIIILPESIRVFNISGDHLWAATHKSRLFKLNRFTLQTEDILVTGVTNSVYADSKGNIWICTVDKGLIKTTNPPVKTVALPDGFFNRNFLSICKWNNKIYAGNYNAEIIESDLSSFITHPVNTDNYSQWQRQLLPLERGLLSCGEAGAFLNFENLHSKSNPGGGIKSMAVLDNDNIIFAKVAVLDKYNFKSNSRQYLVLDRKTAVTVTRDKKIYYGSTDGLFRFDHYDTLKEKRILNPKLIDERINNLFSSKDDLLWAATPSGGVFAFKNDSLLAQISTDNFLISNAVKHIYSEKPGTTWVGTNKGISAIDYSFIGKTFHYNIRNIGVADGLLSPQVNALWVENDTVYAATANGINYFPAGITPAGNLLQVYITGFSVNTRDTSLLSRQSFPYLLKNIVLRFAAPEINGSTVSYQYNINNADWQSNNNGLLELLQLKPGRYTIQFRAIDANGKGSPIITYFSFTIQPAWWQTWWFTALVISVIVGLLFYLLQRSNQKRREKELEQLAAQQKLTDLELQAVKAQINPHFVFNCLNSIKSLIHQYRYEEADKYLDNFSYLLRSTIDHSSKKMIALADEIKYTDNYLLLEQLRFGKKLNYKINAEGIDLKKIALPSMLLQPYVENSIKHGIRNLADGTGFVSVDFTQTSNTLTCRIDDNGVGRETAEKINAANPNYHQSVGLSLTGKREELFGILCHTIDKKDDTGKSGGTTVVLEIPLHYI
jgi:ligand-binding sensor domain-containing protein/anti-sigma regulatory factor (Ser/Thr protein kinase)/uncharacterized membrane-anchored protein YhcB (DUF1043 family)